MSTRHFKLISPLSPAQCAARLAAVINVPPDGHDNLWNGSGQATVCGAVDAEHVLLFVHQGKRSVRTNLNATMTPIESGTVISGQDKRSRGYYLNLLSLMVLICFIVVPIFMRFIHHWQSGTISGFKWLIDTSHYDQGLLWCITAGIGFSHLLDRHQSKFEAKFLQDFLIRTLDAHRATI